MSKLKTKYPLDCHKVVYDTALSLSKWHGNQAIATIIYPILFYFLDYRESYNRYKSRW